VGVAEAQTKLPRIPLNSQRGRRAALSGLSKVPALLTIAAGTLSLAGWLSGFVIVAQLLPSGVAINPVTAVLFIAGGVSLWRAAKSMTDVDWLAVSLGAMVLTFATLKLANYSGAIAFHPDKFPVPTLAQIEQRQPTIEMAPNTAFAFLLCGAALILIHFDTPRRLIVAYQACSLGMGLIGVIALIGYSYHVMLFYRIGVAAPMSLEAALCFALLCLGLLAARPDRGLMTVVTSQTTGGMIARRLLPMAIAVPWVLGALLLAGEKAGYWQPEFGVAIFAVGSLVIFSALIGWNAKLLFHAALEQRHNDMRLAAQHNATRVLAESASVRTAIPELLHVICEALDWKAGLFWSRDGEGRTLRCTESWHSDGLSNGRFLETSRSIGLNKGEDLPGRVWVQAQQVWIENLKREPISERLKLAAKQGLRTACGFPVWIGQDLFGVLEFLSASPAFPDAVLQETLSSVSTQAGLFLERTQAEERLRQTSANLQRSNTDLQQFAYVASHDLFEPLRMVTSYLQLLSHRYKDKLDAQAHDFIGLALDGAKRMEALIHDLLEYSRVDIRGRSFERTECEQVLKAVLSNLKVAIEESGAVIHSGPLPAALGDRVQLIQLFQNLIGNAIKFRGTEAPRVEIRAEECESQWRFTVQDNGIGIDPKYFERIFVLFQRLHTRQEYAGTGMGLAICKKIVERHGGRIWVESTPGQGTTFIFTLPMMKPGPPAAA